MFKKISGDKVLQSATKISNNHYLRAMQEALGLTFPLIIVGSFLLIIMKFPYLPPHISEIMSKYLTKPIASFMYISLFTSFGMGYYLFKRLSSPAESEKGLKVGVTSVIALLILTPFEQNVANTDMQIPLRLLHMHSLLLSFVVGIMTTHLFLWLDTIKMEIKLPADVPPAVLGSFTSLLPVTIILSIFVLISIVFTLLPFDSIASIVYNYIQHPLIQLGGSFVGMILVLLVIQIFWFLGLHGSQMVYPIMDAIWLHNSYDNSLAFLMNQPLEHIVTKQFIEVFPVGAGSMGTFAAGLAVLIFSRSQQSKQVAKMGLPSAFFNISEPLTYGLPIILNPIFLVPWIIGAPLIGAMTYLLMSWGWVPYTTGVNLPWTTPFVISGFFATNSWQGAVLQIVQFIILFMLWIPFILLNNKINRDA